MGGYHVFLYVSRVKSIGMVGVYHESRLARADQREEWTKRLLATNRIEAGRVGWISNVVWFASAPGCQDGFHARRVGLLGAPGPPRGWSMIVWDSADGRVCRVAIVTWDAQTKLPAKAFAEAELILGQNFEDVHTLFGGEVVALVDKDRWLKEGRLEWGTWLPPLQGKPKTFARHGVWPGVYYLFGEDDKVLEVGFFFS